MLHGGSQSVYPRSLFRSTIPFVYPSSGSVGDNGALSGITAIPAITNAYVWMPADAIESGIAAGWYYAVFSSTTAATLYNNTYTTGPVTAPASPTAFATTGPGSYTQEVAAGKQGPTFTLPANTVGPLGKLVFEAAVRWSATATNKSFGVRLGTTSSPSLIPLNSASVGGASFTGRLKANNATNSQTSELWCPFVATTAIGLPLVRSFDMTAANDINPLLTLTAATEWMVLLDFEVIQEA